MNKPLQNQRGVAMMMAMITMLLMTILAAELIYETSVYNGIVFRQVETLRARMLARSGLRLALLQVRAAKKAAGMAKGMGMGDSANSLVDQLWQTPLILPPPVPPGAGGIETTAITEFNKELNLQGTISINITGENSRVSLNEIIYGRSTSTSTGTATGTSTSTATSTAVDTAESRQKELQTARTALVEIVDSLLQKRRETDEKFADRTSNLNGQILVGNLLAWMDPNTPMDGENRDKLEYYNRHDPPYSPKEAPLVHESEIFMVKGFDDEIARIFQDNFTTQFTNAVNVNDATPLLLQALIPELNANDAELIVKRRNDETQGGKFKSEQEFWAFLETIGDFSQSKARLQNQGKKLLGSETAYRVTVTGTSGGVTKTWVALVGPYPPAPKAPIRTGEDGQPLPPNPPNPTPPNQGANAKKNDAQDLHVLYLKAD